MTAATETQPQQRPELHVVPDAPEAPEQRVPPETDCEVTDTIPAVTARPPWDVRAREKALQLVRDVPAFGQGPVTFAESIDYSQRGDWTTSETGAKRVAHGLATLIAYAVTYPLVEGLERARRKPVGFCLVLILLIVVGHLV